MIHLNTFILVAVAASIVFVGVLAWLVDSGLNDKMKVYVKFTLFGMFACILGLFFLIEDDSEFQYGGYTPSAKTKGQSSPNSSGGGGGGGGSGGSEQISDGGGGGGDLVSKSGKEQEESDLVLDEKPELAEEGDGVKQDCPTCPEIVPIRNGKALIGSPDAVTVKAGQMAPASDVAISRDFGIGKYEVTFEQFSAFSNETGYRTANRCKAGKASVSFEKPGFKQTPTSPAVCVAFKDALAYVEWLSMKTQHTYRLPTEIEWEYAARAGVTGAYVTGDVMTGNLANYKAPGEPRKPGTRPVGSYPANGNDMHDVHGNVWELTADCWSKSYLGAPGSGAGAVDCTRRVAKGGGWFSGAAHLNFAMRVGVGDKFANNGLGFRVVREATPKRRKRQLSNGFAGGMPDNFKKEARPKKISYDPVAKQLVRGER